MLARWLPDKRAAAAAMSNGVGKGTLYFLYQRKAGGDVWKDGERPCKKADCDHVNVSSPSIIGNRSGAWGVAHAEYGAVPVSCTDPDHDPPHPHRRHFVFLGIVRHPITRWGSEMIYSGVHKKLPAFNRVLNGNATTAKIAAGVAELRVWMGPGLSGASPVAPAPTGGEYSCIDMIYYGSKKNTHLHLWPHCCLDGCLVRFLIQKDCECLIPLGRNAGDTSCAINFTQPIAEREFQQAKRAASAGFHALVPLEMLACDQARVIALFRSVGLHIDPDFTFRHTHKTAARVGRLAVAEVSEFFAEFEADNEWDLKLYHFIADELYPSYFCREPMTTKGDSAWTPPR